MAKGILIKNGGGISLPTLTNEATSNELLVGKELINSKGEVLVGTGNLTELNFEVVAYTSEDSLPETAEENTIAVITDAEITSWIFSANEPESPAEGMVWIEVGTSSSSEINAIKKNTLLIYPSAVMQYINGSFISKQSRVFIEEEWKELGVLRVFYYGIHRTDLTGGWVSIGTQTGSFVEAEDYLQVSLTSDTGNSCRYRTVNKIDLTDVRAVVFTAQHTSSSGGTNRSHYHVRDDDGAVVIVYSSSFDKTSHRLDVSTLEGEYYIAFGVHFSESRTFTNTVYAIELIYK